MKRKDLILLIAAVAILLVAGYIVYTQLMGSKTSKASVPKVEVVGSISKDIDPSNQTLSQINSASVTDYTVPVDSLPANNPALFGR